MARRQRNYAAEYAVRKRRQQARIEAEQNRRRERLEILARAKHTKYVPPAKELYYQTPGQQRYWESVYPKRIKGMESDARNNLARARGIDTVLPGWDNGDDYPPAISDAIAEYYLLGYMSKSRDPNAHEAREYAQDLYFRFGTEGIARKPNWRAFREAYTRNFNR